MKSYIKIGSYVNIEILPALFLVMLMVASSLFFDSREIILPELSALSIGCFVYKIPHWTSRPKALFFVPSATAIIGFLVNMLEISLPLKLIIVILAMILFLKIVGSTLAPSLATGLLPVITNCQSMAFIYSILVFMLLLFLIVRLFYKSEAEKAPKEKNKLTLPFLLLMIVWILVCVIINLPAMYAIPPIVVVAFEYIQIKQYSYTLTFKHIVLLVLSAAIGTLTVLYLHQLLVSVVIDFVLVTFFAKILNVKLPPAYAMAILPMVLGDHLTMFFPLYVLIMSLVIFNSIILFKRFLLTEKS